MINQSNCASTSYFLQIKKYPVLTRKEEIVQINNIDRYKNIFHIALASDVPAIKSYLNLLEIRDKFFKKTGTKIQPTQWAKAASINIEELNSIKQSAYQEWAVLANITVAQLNLIEKNGVEARERIVLCNLQLVVKIAKSYQNLGLDLIDLIQEGTIGLHLSIDRFNPTRGYKFITYAAYWIKKNISKSIDDNSRMIRLPRHIINLQFSIKRASKLLSFLDGEDPLLSKLSNYLNISEQQIRYILEKSAKVLSTNISINRQGENQEILDSIPTENRQYTTDDILNQYTLTKLISNLNFKERQVINLRYLRDTQTTFSEIGKTLEMTAQGVRKIEIGAINKLRHSLDLAS